MTMVLIFALVATNAAWLWVVAAMAMDMTAERREIGAAQDRLDAWMDARRRSER